MITEWEKEIAPIVKRRIVRVLANPIDIERYLKEFYGVSRSITRPLHDLVGAANALADGDLTFNYQTQPVVIELKRANGDRFTFSAPTHVATRALLAESDAILRRIVGRVAC
jgi:methyl-accepting chemotaxis protein